MAAGRGSLKDALSPPGKGPLTEALVKRVLARVGSRLTDPVREPVTRAWGGTLNRLFGLGGSSDGNRVTVFHHGEQAFAAMLEAIAQAKARVWLETYILEPDSLGLAILQALTEAARRGADVLLIYDAFGSPDLGPEHTRALAEAGGRVVAFNPLFALRRRLPVMVRDHRKILIADTTGFAGGMNVSREYTGPPLGDGRFRDTHARIEGPSVRHLAAVLAGSLLEATGDTLPLLEPPPSIEGGCFVQVLGSGTRRKRRHIQRALRQAIARAVHRVYLTTPYFVPSRSLLRALVIAAKRGADVRVLTAGDSDVPAVRRATHHLAGRLLRRGVRIYELYGQTLHAKTATLDGVYASVGSFNLDRWSYQRNLEVNVTVIDTGQAEHLEAQFHEDLEHAHELSYPRWRERSLPTRLVDWLAYVFLRL